MWRCLSYPFSISNLQISGSPALLPSGRASHDRKSLSEVLTKAAVYGLMSTAEAWPVGISHTKARSIALIRLLTASAVGLVDT